jgi:hypothetical protein
VPSGPLRSKVSATSSFQYNRFLEPIDAASAVPVLNVLAASPQTSDIRPSRNPSHSKVSATPYISWQRFGSGSRVCGAEHETRPCMGVCAVGGERSCPPQVNSLSLHPLVIAVVVISQSFAVQPLSKMSRYQVVTICTLCSLKLYLVIWKFFMATCTNTAEAARSAGSHEPRQRVATDLPTD